MKSELELTKKGKVVFAILFGLVISLCASAFFYFFKPIQGEEVLNKEIMQDKYIANRLDNYDTIIVPFEDDDTTPKGEKENKENKKEKVLTNSKTVKSTEKQKEEAKLDDNKSKNKDQEQKDIKPTKDQLDQKPNNTYKKEKPLEELSPIFSKYMKEVIKNKQTLGLIEINPKDIRRVSKGFEQQIEDIKNQLNNGTNLADKYLVIVYFKDYEPVTKKRFLDYSQLTPYLQDLKDLGLEIYLMKQSPNSPSENNIRCSTVKEGYVVDSVQTGIESKTPIKISMIQEGIPSIVGYDS